jgi:hypothetical protein
MSRTHNAHTFLTSATRTLDGKDYVADFSTMPDAGIAYLLQYGFSQAMADSTAVGAVGMIAATVKAKMFTEAESKAMGDTQKSLNAFIAALPADQRAAYEAWSATFLAERAAARLSAIQAGEMVFNATNSLTPEERDRRDLTASALKDAAIAQSLKLPKKAEDLRPMLEFIYNAKAAEIEAEVSRRAKVRAKTTTVDLSGLAALIAA